MEQEDTIQGTPPELREVPENAVKRLLPKKSKNAYDKEFLNFNTWCEEHNVQEFSENILLAYFEIQSEHKKPSTLWSTYSKLKTCLNVYKNVDITKYMKLQALLKRLSCGYEPKKSRILEMDDINHFIQRADDQHYLSLKVALIIGYNGACRREELTNMSVDDIEYRDDSVFVTVPKTKTNISRMFAITEQSWIDLIKKYANLHPKHTTHRRFFLTYCNGCCINSPIGINTMGKMPQLIARYLKLPNPEQFTGHCFRRSSASHLANKGGDLVTIKRHGGWKSSAVAEGYIETSKKRKIEVAQMLQPNVSSSTSCITNEIHEVTFKNNENTTNIPKFIHINAHDSCNVNVKVYNNCTFQNMES